MSNNEKEVYKSNKLYFSIDKSFMCKLEMTQNLAKRKHNADNQKKRSKSLRNSHSTRIHKQ